MGIAVTSSARKVHFSTIVLVTIGMVDLVSTLIWLNMGQSEANPLFATLAAHGSIAFALAKIAFLALPVAIIEYARTKRPITAEVGTWIAITLYAFLWIRHIIEL